MSGGIANVIENPSQLYVEDDFDFLTAEHHLHQRLSDWVSPAVQPSTYRVVTGVLRIGAAAIILSMVTGMMQAGAVVALIGAAFLYCRIADYT